MSSLAKSSCIGCEELAARVLNLEKLLHCFLDNLPLHGMECDSQDVMIEGKDCNCHLGATVEALGL